MDKKFILLILGVTAFIAIVGYYTGPLGKGRLPDLKSITSKKEIGNNVNIKGRIIEVEIADTPEKRRQGLSGKKELQEDRGMLFVFGEKNQNPFWMKDMNFPIDIIWIDDGKIVGIEKDVKPEPGVIDQNLRLYYPPKTISHVLEVPAGYSAEKGFSVGDNVEINLK